MLTCQQTAAIERFLEISYETDESCFFFVTASNCAKKIVTREGVERRGRVYVVPKVGLPWPEWIKA